MATLTLPTSVTVVAFTGGVVGQAGRGVTYRVTVGGTWAAGDKFTFQVVTPSQTFDLGVGRMTGLVPVKAISLNDRVHFVAGSFWNGSDNGDPTAWEQQAPGAFQINVSNMNQQPEPLMSLSSFQGRIALWSRQTTQIWSLDANPLNISLQQVLNNIGSVSPFGPQSLGDFDVLFPSDSGIRSLRIQTINLNGFISDIGSPIDLLTKAAIAGQTLSQLAGIQAIVDPVGGRYLVYFPSVSKIYALSYFPASKITAWTYFTPSNYDVATAQTAFTVKKFLIYNGMVYLRVTLAGNDYILAYGSTYDNTQPSVIFPWLDFKRAGQRKTMESIDYALQGQWSVYGSMDFNGVLAGAALQTIALQVNKGSNAEAGSFQTGSVDWTDEGFHVVVKVIADDPSTVGKNAIFSEIVLHYTPGDEK